MKNLPIMFNQAEKKADVLVYDVIGCGWFMDGVSAKNLAMELQQHGPLDLIVVRINSPGGAAYDGIAIYNTLKSNPARKLVIVEGMAASAASVIAMVGDEIVMHANTSQMCHEGMGGVFGKAKDLRKEAEVLDMLTGQIADTYAARTGLKREEIVSMLEAETWLDAPTAVAKGFATRVEENKQAVPMNFDLSHFKHPPANVLKLCNQAPPGTSEKHTNDMSDLSIDVRKRLLELDDHDFGNVA